MIRASRFASLGLVAGALLVAGAAQAQGNAARGKTLFQSRGCTGCHAFGKKVSGPDLVGVTDRRSAEWLKTWLKDPPAMMATDSTAKQLLADAHDIKMPNLHLSDPDIDALIAYMAEAGKKK